MNRTTATVMNDLPGLTASRYRSTQDFLATRGLTLDWLEKVMRGHTGPGELLLTSSPVHGLANETSDLDFILIQQEPITGPRISTKIFEAGHHLEVTTFSAGELAATFTAMRTAAAGSPADQLAFLRSWDARREPRRKPTERIINGLTLDGTAPYLDHLPALAELWARNSLQAALEHVVHLALAERAGESRGRLGYAYNALLHLMDTVLSLQGDVYTTRKFYLLRWTRHVAANRGDQACREVSATVEQARAELGTLIAAPHPAGPLTPAYIRLSRQVRRLWTADGPVRVRIQPRPNTTADAYLRGSALVTRGDTSVIVRAGTPPRIGPVDLFDLADLSAATARDLLTLIRAGIAEVRFDYPMGGSDE